MISLNISTRSSWSSKRARTFRYLMYGKFRSDILHLFFPLEEPLILASLIIDVVYVVKVWNSELIEISATKFVNPQALAVLYERNLFLIFRNRTAAVWNFQGELVTSFEDHLLWHDNVWSANDIYITKDEGRIISYCKSEAVEDDGTGALLKTLHFLEIASFIYIKIKMQLLSSRELLH